MSLQNLHNRFYRLTTLAATALIPVMAQAQEFHFEKAFDATHLLTYLIAGMFISIFVLLFYNRLYAFKEQEGDNELKSQNARLGLVMQAGRLQLWIYNTDTRHYRFITEKGDYSREYNPVEFARFFHYDDFEKLRSAIFDVCEGRRLTATVNLRSSEDDGKKLSYYETHISIAKKDFRGNIHQILGVQHDITDEQVKKDSTSEILMRYHTVFNSSLIDMLYFDKEGVLKEINETACHSLKVQDAEELIRQRMTYQENPLFNHIDYHQAKHTVTSTFVDFAKYKGARFLNEAFKDKMLYYEASINTIQDKHGELEGIYIIGRNITEMVESFHQQQQGAIQLKKATQHIQEYIDNINYALRVSNVRLVNYYPERYTLDISNIVGKPQIRLSQLRCIRLAAPQDRRNVSSVLNRMDHLTRYTITQTIATEFHDKQGRQTFLMFNLIPIFNHQGQVERYFGMCREQTDIVETERRLAIETKKAQEAELLKESFLTNMSYEIRTPLTAVLGFAELFEQEHDESDEAIFVEEIKKNTNSLLLLINDILFLSRLDADMVEFKHDAFDFAEYFDAYCQMGWSSIRPNVKTSIENPYEHLVLEGDIEQLGKAINMLCQNAAFYTKEGSVRAKYEYRRGELVISIEDTGVGIDADNLPHAMERFNRNKDEELCGTGLNLPIIEAIIQKMGGSIELQSEINKGTTVWIFLPSQAKTVVKKSEIIINE